MTFGRHEPRRRTAPGADDRAVVARLDALLAGGSPAVAVPADLLADVRHRLDQAWMIAEYSSDVVVRGNNNGTIEWISESVTDGFGWRPDQLSGRQFLEFVHPEDRHIVYQARATLSQGEVLTYAVRFRAEWGEYRWISLRVAWVVDDDGVVIGRIGGWRDITEEVVSAEAVTMSERRLRHVFETMFDPLIMISPLRDDSGTVIDFLYADANSAACAYNGMSHDELVGRRLLELFPRLAPSGLFARCVHVLATGEPLVLDAFRYPNDILDSDRYYDIRVVRIGDELSYTWRDVTDRHDLIVRRLDDAVVAPIIDASTRLAEIASRLPSDDRDELLEVLDLHDAAVRGLRATTDELRPTTAAPVDVGAELGAVLSSLVSRTDITTGVTISGTGSLGDPLLEAHILTVARDTFETALAALAPSRLTAHLSHDAESVRLRITARVGDSSPDPSVLDRVVGRARSLGAFCSINTRTNEIELVWRAARSADSTQSSSGSTSRR